MGNHLLSERERSTSSSTAGPVTACLPRCRAKQGPLNVAAASNLTTRKFCSECVSADCRTVHAAVDLPLHLAAGRLFWRSTQLEDVSMLAWLSHRGTGLLPYEVACFVIM